MDEQTAPPVSGLRGPRIYFLGLIGVVVIWGSSFVVVDAAVQIAPPLAIATWRFVFATVLFLIFTPIAKKLGFWQASGKDEGDGVNSKDSIRGNRKDDKGGTGNEGKGTSENPPISIISTRRYFVYNVLASLTGISLFFPAQYIAISIIGASIPALVVCLASPVITTILAIAFFKERLIKVQVVGFVFASVGAFLILTGGDLSRLTPASADFAGTILALLTPFMWSVYNIAVKKASQRGSSFQITSYTTYLGLAGLFVVLFLSGGFEGWFIAITHVEVVGAVIYLAAGCSLFGYLMWNIALDHLQTANVGAFLYAEPFITVLFAWVFLQQGIALVSLLGGGIVLVALVLITRHKTTSLKRTKS